MKIGLITLHDYNYGSALQCYATQLHVDERHGDCILLCLEPPGNRVRRLFRGVSGLLGLCIAHPGSARNIAQVFLAQRTASLTLTRDSQMAIKRFIYNEMRRETHSWKELCDIGCADEYLAFLSGSDQVWNGARINNYGMYFLRFAPMKKRIAWAPSFGNDGIASYNLLKYRKYLEEYQHLSVREQSGAEIVKKLTGKEAEVLSDPVMLLTADSWRARYQKDAREALPQKPYILLFFIDTPSESAMWELKRMVGNMDISIFSFGYKYDCFQEVNGWLHMDGSPWDFLHMVDNASEILTDSFHATVFSSIFHVPFYVFSRSYQHGQNQSVRITAYLKEIDLLNRFDPTLCELNQPFDFSKADGHHLRSRQRAIRYLDKVLPVKEDEKDTEEKTLLFAKPSECCGCGACFAICNQKAIHMSEGKNGAIYPVIDIALCVDCGMCRRVCPLKKAKAVPHTKKRAYVGYGNDDKLNRLSASGGIFATLARKIIEDGGLVYGAAMIRSSNGKIECKHILAQDFEGLARIQGSKYVQSHTEHVFADIQQQLSAGKQVLFSGTSCQVAALKTYLNREYENLYTIDLICHGVPGDGLLSDYIVFLERKEKCKVVDFSFRRKDKRQFGEAKMPYILTITCQDIRGKQWEKLISLRKSAYYRMFMSGAGYRDACYSCRYASADKPADITLGDYYVNGQELNALDAQHQLSRTNYLSCVLVHTERGHSLLLKENYCKLLEISLDQAIRDHAQLMHPSFPNRNGEKMFALYQQEGYAGLQKYIDRRNTMTWIPRIGKKLLFQFPDRK